MGLTSMNNFILLSTKLWHTNLFEKLSINVDQNCVRIQKNVSEAEPNFAIKK